MAVTPLGERSVALALEAGIVASDDLIDSGSADADRAGHITAGQAVAERVGDHEIVSLKSGLSPTVFQIAEPVECLGLTVDVNAWRRVGGPKILIG